jgi:hypothetical protein
VCEGRTTDGAWRSLGVTLRRAIISFWCGVDMAGRGCYRQCRHCGATLIVGRLRPAYASSTDLDDLKFCSCFSREKAPSPPAPHSIISRIVRLIVATNALTGMLVLKHVKVGNK